MEWEIVTEFLTEQTATALRIDLCLNAICRFSTCVDLYFVSKIPPGDEFALGVISYIGLGLSLCALLLAFITISVSLK